MPDIAIAAVNLVRCSGNRNIAFFSVGNRFVPGPDIPLAPWRNNFEMRRKCLVCELKPHLIVALAGTSVGNGISTFFQRDLNLALGQKRPRDGGSKQILSFVHGAGFNERPEVFGYELMAEIFDIAFGSTGTDRFFFETLQLIILADVAGHSDDFATVVLLEPWNDDRGIKSAEYASTTFFARSFIIASGLF